MLIDHNIPTSFSQQISLLKSRNLIFNDESRALKYLSYIGYHRLAMYWNTFYVDKHTKEQFKSQIKFEDILQLYIFDRKLRTLFMEAAERIEVCFKVLFSNILSTTQDNAFWFLNGELFSSRKDIFYIDCKKQEEIYNHSKLLDDINSNILKFKKNIDSLHSFSDIATTRIPSWQLVDVITFGNFSKMISLVKGEYSTKFYEVFCLPKAIFDNWLECIVSVRNICAHYGLFYRRTFSTTPRSLSKSKKRARLIDLEEVKSTFYAEFFIFSFFMKQISPSTSWCDRVLSLIKENLNNPHLSLELLGFRENWYDNIIFEDKKDSFNNSISL